MSAGTLCNRLASSARSRRKEVTRWRCGWRSLRHRRLLPLCPMSRRRRRRRRRRLTLCPMSRPDCSNAWAQPRWSSSNLHGKKMDNPVISVSALKGLMKWGKAMAMGVMEAGAKAYPVHVGWQKTALGARCLLPHPQLHEHDMRCAFAACSMRAFDVSALMERGVGRGVPGWPRGSRTGDGTTGRGRKRPRGRVGRGHGEGTKRDQRREIDDRTVPRLG
jgi:hypothetical protein